MQILTISKGLVGIPYHSIVLRTSVPLSKNNFLHTFGYIFVMKEIYVWVERGVRISQYIKPGQQIVIKRLCRNDTSRHTLKYD